MDGPLFKNFIPIHSWKFFVRQFFDQFSWFKITIKVSKWHKNGMNSIKMIKSSFTRKWSHKSQWSIFKKLIQKLHVGNFRHSKWDFIKAKFMYVSVFWKAFHQFFYSSAPCVRCVRTRVGIFPGTFPIFKSQDFWTSLVLGPQDHGTFKVSRSCPV